MNSFTRIIAVLFFLTIYVGASAQGNGASTTNQNVGPRVMPSSTVPDTISFSLWHGLIVVDALFGDGIGEQGVLHTGLPVSMVSPILAAKKSMQTQGLVDIKVMDRNIRVPGIKPQLLRMDRFVIANVNFGICDVMGTMSNQTLENVPTVWIGNSALEALTFTVDPRKMEIALRPANSQPPPKCIRVPFVLRDHRLFMELTVNGKQKFEAILDTGSVGTLIPSDIAKKLKITPVTTAEVEEKNGKKVKMGIARLDEIMLGKLHVKDIQALYIVEPIKDGPDPDMAIIGNDLLLRYKFTIDYGKLEIYFEELPPLPVVKPTVPKPIIPEKKPEIKPDKGKTGSPVVNPTIGVPGAANVAKDPKASVPTVGPVYGPPIEKMNPPEKQSPPEVPRPPNTTGPPL